MLLNTKKNICAWLINASANQQLSAYWLLAYCLTVTNTVLHFRSILVCNWKHTNTHTPHNHFTALWILSGTTRVSQYQKKHSPTDTYPDHQSSFICFLLLLWSMASSQFNLCAWQSFCTISVQVLFGLPLGLAPSTSYSIHFFTKSFYFCSTCPYHRNLFCCSTKIISSNPNLSLNSLYLELYLLPYCHTSIWPFSSLSAEVPSHFLFLQGRSQFYAAYYFACNCCTISLSL